MSLFNGQTFLQILRSTTLSDNEYVQKELNVIADLLEEYDVESPSELKQKLRAPKKKSTSSVKKSKYDLFVDEYILFTADKETGNDVDAQIETLVQKFQELTPANIKKFAESFELLLSSKKDASQFRTWLLTGQKPLAPEEERALFVQEITQIYQDSNGNFTEEKIQVILGIVRGIKDKYNVKELKGFVQLFEPGLTAGTKDALIQKWEDCLRGVKSTVHSNSKRSSKQGKSLDLENNPYKNEISGLIDAFNDNPTEETKHDVVQKIVAVLETLKSEYNFTTLKKFVQNVFDSKITSNKADIFIARTTTFIENNILCVPNVSFEENQKQEALPTLKVPNQSQDDTTAIIEEYVHKALQLRDEKSYDLTDENILKIVDLAEEVKKIYKIEGLKSFMDALGISYAGVKNGDLLDRILNRLGDVAIMRCKAVRIQEMK